MLKSLKRQRDEKGFTLIELLIVIIILGILAAIVVFAIGSSRGDAVQNSCKTSIKSMSLSAEAYKTKQGSYPQGTGTAASPVNDLLASTGTGGLLHEWPNSTDYSLKYIGTVNKGGAGGAAPAGTNAGGYTITVLSGSTTMAHGNGTDAAGTINDLSPDGDVTTACTTS